MLIFSQISRFAFSLRPVRLVPLYLWANYILTISGHKYIFITNINIVNYIVQLHLILLIVTLYFFLIYILPMKFIIYSRYLCILGATAQPRLLKQVNHVSLSPLKNQHVTGPAHFIFRYFLLFRLEFQSIFPDAEYRYNIKCYSTF